MKSMGQFNASSFSKPEKTMNTGYSDPFYSVLIKHQLNMIKAWSPTQANKSSEIDTLSLSKVLLKLKGMTSSADSSQPTVNSRRIMQSYETEQKLTEEVNLDKNSIQSLTANIANQNGIPEKLFQKLIQTESGYDPKALSPRGAMGLGQIMPETAKELGLSIGDSKTNGSVWHPESNLDASARYLKKLYDKYRKEGISGDESWSFAAGAYNAGMGNIAKAISKIGDAPLQTWDQVAEVLPKVTGKYSKETIRYVNRLRA